MNFTSKNNIRLRAGHYRISDIASRVDRSITAIVRWEKLGLIPKAKRDSRGWRVYAKDQIDAVVDRIQKQIISRYKS